MPRRYSARPSYRATSRFVSRSEGSVKDYATGGTGTVRHQFNKVAGGVPGVLPPSLYFYHELVKFYRSAGPGDDEPLTPANSNNSAGGAVFNGSRISNYKSTIRVKNLGAIPAYLDVYELQLSFFDALLFNTIQTASCPITFDSTTVGPPDVRGAVAPKAPSATLIVDNTVKDFKFIQHYMKKKGTIFVPATDGANSEVTINIDRVPAKCRRSQTGMFWGLFFVNEANKNAGNTLALGSTQETSFDEIPSSNRLPYLQ